METLREGEAGCFVPDLNTNDDQQFIQGDITDVELEIETRFDLFLTDVPFLSEKKFSAPPVPVQSSQDRI